MEGMLFSGFPCREKEGLKEWWQPCLVGALRGLGVVDELHAPTGRVLRFWGIGLAVWFFGRIPVAGHQFRHHLHFEAQTWPFALFLPNVTTFAQVVEAASPEVTSAADRLTLLATPVAAQSHRPRAHTPQHHTWSKKKTIDSVAGMFVAEHRCNNGRYWEVESQLWHTPVIAAYVTVHCAHAPFVGSFLGRVLIATSIWTCTPLLSAPPLWAPQVCTRISYICACLQSWDQCRCFNAIQFVLSADSAQ